MIFTRAIVLDEDSLQQIRMHKFPINEAYDSLNLISLTLMGQIMGQHAWIEHVIQQIGELKAYAEIWLQLGTQTIFVKDRYSSDVRTFTLETLPELIEQLEGHRERGRNFLD